VQPSFEITVAARGSQLSRRQVEEVYTALKKIYPHILFKVVYVVTTGDRDKITSLRNLERTDFFTREIDQMLLNKECRIAIHSAKDLPHPLPQGLFLAALTRGVDPADSLVLREQESLPSHGIVATSSERREACVRQLFPQVHFVDIRGTIEERLAKLDSREVDGVVIAEAALIRLGWTHRHRICLPGETALHQGRLAIVAREEDEEMRQLFSIEL
jgi:hydroxymethylbilane synthase